VTAEEYTRLMNARKQASAEACKCEKCADKRVARAMLPENKR
jgi:hypothetical protein